MKENAKSSLPGIPTLLGLLVLGLGVIALFIAGAADKQPAYMVVAAVLAFALMFLMAGLYKLEPNQSAVLSLFGKYVGTVKDNGLRWNNPFFSKRKVSLRIRNFESSRLKVNELDGSPIEIAAVIVWQVVDSAEAVFNVDDYESFVHIQSEAALRAMASSYPYDQHEEGQIALRSHPQEISQHLQDQIAERLGKAGVDVIEARISHLAYAPEIARGHAAAATGQRGDRGPHADRRRRGGHGGNGVGRAAEERCGEAGRRAQGTDGQQPAGGAVRRARHAADRQHRLDLLTGRYACTRSHRSSSRSPACPRSSSARG